MVFFYDIFSIKCLSFAKNVLVYTLVKSSKQSEEKQQQKNTIYSLIPCYTTEILLNAYFQQQNTLNKPFPLEYC